MRRRLVALLAAVVAVAGCTGGEGEEAAPTPSPQQTSAAPTPSAPSTEDEVAAAPVPPLAAAPEGDATLWLDTIGIPVVAAVRTSTALTTLDEVAPDAREPVCRQVAFDLDAIAAPQVLTGLAITADAETATLLVGDLQAKADLLAACATGGGDLDGAIAEVQRTHAVAVAWLSLLRGGT